MTLADPQTLPSAYPQAVDANPRERVLHVFPSFGVGGVPLRMVRVINHFAPRFAHSVIALDDNFDAASQFDATADVTLLPAPSRREGMLRAALAGARMLRRLRPDLLVTYNWGAIEWAIGNRLSPVPRHIHFEAGFGKEEADTQIRRRVLCRRWALARSTRVVVPSRGLETLARDTWHLPAGRVTYLPNGVDVERFAAPSRDTVPGFNRQAGELVVGTVAPLRPEKNVGRLLRVFAMIDSPFPVRLIIVGDGTERGKLGHLADELGIADRVVFTGQMNPEMVLGSFDIFALSSDTEQMPNALLEAMAASRAVAAVDVGDVRTMVAAENQKFIIPRDDHTGFAAAIGHLLENDGLRAELGRQNRDRVAAEFSQDRMFAGYAEIFATGRAGPA